MKRIEKYLELEVIWKDDDMFELRISVDNGRYSGITEVYDQREPLYEFASKLNEFPNGLDGISHSAGKKDSYAYFEMRFYLIDPTGKVGVLVTLEENVSSEYRENEKDKLKLELIVEPAAIDNFQKELQTLAMKEEGKARLNGIKRS
jgi:hypothetical protein